MLSPVCLCTSTCVTALTLAVLLATFFAEDACNPVVLQVILKRGSLLTVFFGFQGRTECRVGMCMYRIIVMLFVFRDASLCRWSSRVLQVTNG